MKKLFIFDFDGTLVDTITDVGICFNKALQHCGFPQHPLSAFSSFVGGNLETVVSKMLPSELSNQANIDAVKTIYRQLYLQSEKPNTRPFPDIMELLYRLKEKGAFIAVNSNKGQTLLDDMVSRIFPANFFDAVIGYEESRPSKPDPWGVHFILEKTGCRTADTVYIGDGVSDIMTAYNAGIDMIYVCWGQGTSRDENHPYCKWRCHSVQELAGILTGKNNDEE